LPKLDTVRFQDECWQEPCESRGSRTDLWGRGGEIPLRYPTLQSLIGGFLDKDLVLLLHNITKAMICWYA
jgi:hypothetical protein